MFCDVLAAVIALHLIKSRAFARRQSITKHWHSPLVCQVLAPTSDPITFPPFAFLTGYKSSHVLFFQLRCGFIFDVLLRESFSLSESAATARFSDVISAAQAQRNRTLSLLSQQVIAPAVLARMMMRILFPAQSALSQQHTAAIEQLISQIKARLSICSYVHIYIYIYYYIYICTYIIPLFILQSQVHLLESI
jgi:hypothetical protein